MDRNVGIGVTVGSSKATMDFTLYQARAAFDSLEGWLFSPEALSMAEHTVELEMEKRGREVWRLMLQAHLNQRGTGNIGPAIEISSPSGESTVQRATREDRRNVVSLFGGVTVQRTAYTAGGTQAVHPLDEQAQLPDRSFSYALQKRVSDESVRGSFDEALENIEKTTGNQLSKRSAEQITIDAAADFDAFYERQAAPVAIDTGPILVGQADGKGVPMVKPKNENEKAAPVIRRKKGEKPNKKKMATVAAVYTQHPRVRTPESVIESLFKEKQDPEAKNQQDEFRPENKRVWASLAKNKTEVIEDMATEMQKRDADKSKLRVVLTDGERALQRLVQKTMLGILLVLDFLHVLERLWLIAHAFYGEGTKEATEWVRKHALMLLQGKVSQVVKGIRQSVTKRKLSGKKKKKVLGAANYLYNNREYMRYDFYLALGLPIATGTIEGACRHLVKDRMERAGMRWRIPGAEAILRLRALKVSGHSDEYCKFHIQQEQKRLFGQKQWKLAS